MCFKFSLFWLPVKEKDKKHCYNVQYNSYEHTLIRHDMFPNKHKN